MRLILTMLLVAAGQSPVRGQLTALGGEFQVNTATVGDQEFPGVAMAPSGRFVVVWTDNQNPEWNVRWQPFGSNGVPPDGERSLSFSTDGREEAPTLSSVGDGTFIAAWQATPADGSGFGVLTRSPLEAPGVVVGLDLLVNTYTESSQNRPDVAAAADGSFVMVWTSATQDGDGLGVFGARFVFVPFAVSGDEMQINTFTAGHQQRPAVALLPDGGYAVVWEGGGDQDGDGVGVFGQRYDAIGGRQGTEFQVNSYTPGDQQWPALAVGADGTMLVAWYGPGPNGDDDVLGQWYSPTGSPLGGEVGLASAATNAQQRPAAASFEPGFVVTWHSYQSFTWDVRARVFDPAGGPAGDEFVANSYTTGNQVDAAVAAVSNGFVVVWHSFGQDGDRLGVFGQRYDVRPTETAPPTASATPSASPTPSATATATATVPAIATATTAPTGTATLPVTTPTATSAATLPIPTPTPTSGATSTASAAVSPTALACPGDCDGDGHVRIDELLRAVNIALGARSVDACPAADRAGDGGVGIADLIAAVAAALGACA